MNENIIYNKKYMLILPNYDEKYYKYFSYTFGCENIYSIKNPGIDMEKIVNIINNSNIEKIIFIDYLSEYNIIINKLNKIHKLYFIVTKQLSRLSSIYDYEIFNNILKLYEANFIEKIGFMDINFYKAYSKKINSFHIKLKKESESPIKYNKKRIGILGNECDNYCSYYNILSAIKLNNKYAANTSQSNSRIDKFKKLFNIKRIENDKDKYSNLINIDINFSGDSFLNFVESMDKGIPCIVGNNNFLNKKLEEYLMVKSDDNIDEISDKIDRVVENKEKINNEYKKWKNEYYNNFKENIEKELDIKIEKLFDEKYQKLITIVVPVYNTDKYLEKCLQSILKAIIENIEILIINDGSTDKSQEIIDRYCQKYPKIIRCISQTNHGLGNVRNVALKNAKGKYIASIDSDDTINANFFKEAEIYLKKDIDIVIYDWLSKTDKSNFETPAIEWIFNSEKKVNKYEGLLYTTIMPSTCNKIIKSELYKKLNIKFMEDKYEDFSTNPFILSAASSIKYINKPYYEYYIRSNSIMRTSAGLSMINVIKEVNKRIIKYREYITVDIEKLKYYLLSWRIEEFIINQLYTVDEKEIDNYIKYMNDNIRDVIIEMFNNKYYKNMIERLSKNHQKYINERNKNIKNNEIKKFILKQKKEKECFKLTAPIIYYGEQ